MKKLVLFIAVLVIGAVAILNLKFAEPAVGPMSAPAEVTAADLPEASNAPSMPATSRTVLLTMDEVSSAKNQIWTGAFQLVWNDLIDKLNKEPITFVSSQPPVVALLNRRSFDTEDLSEKSYYQKWGPVSLALKQEIEEGIFTKFHEKSRILDQFDWMPAPDKYFLYAMLKKNLDYVESFDDLGEGQFAGSEQLVKYFGVTSQGSSSLKKSVRVLFYNNEEDFALTLTSQQGDLIHLYRTNQTGTLEQLYTTMKQQVTDERDFLHAGDEFKAPKLNMNMQQEFPELCNRSIFPTGFVISKALEAIEFKMDEKGAQLVAEAGMVSLRSMVISSQKRMFYVTGAYALFLEEEGKTPYFAAHITDVAAIM